MRIQPVPFALRLVSVCCLTIGAAIAPVANAGYTVIDDDLYPTSMVEARRAQQWRDDAPEVVEQHHSIKFRRQQSATGAVVRRHLDALLPEIRVASSIRIVGRPDAMPGATRDKLLQLARARAINVKNYLIRLGIDDRLIKIEADPTPNPQVDGTSYPSDLYLTMTETVLASPPPAIRAPRPTPVETRRALEASQALRAPLVVDDNTVPVAAPSRSDAAVLQYINQAVRSGELQPDVALQIIRSMVMAGAAPQRIAADPSPTQTPRTWSLDKRLSLRANLDEWSRLAGWNPTIWEASNAYQVTDSVAVTGVFPEVLRRVADATGLNICPVMSRRVVRVTEAGVRCDQ